MAQHHKLQKSNGGDEENQLLLLLMELQLHHHRSNLKMVVFLLLGFLIFTSIVFLTFSSLPLFRYSGEPAVPVAGAGAGSVCTGKMTNDSICCDRTSSERTDVCVLTGDVRIQAGSSSNSIYMVAGNRTSPAPATVVERIRPYTRKWESSVMATIDEVRLLRTGDGGTVRCDVRHDVPAVVFSTGGYTGNVYHEFNDGIIPLYLTARKFEKKVVFVILEYHDWWMMKYGDIVSQLSDYAPIDFAGDRRVHCFREAIVGLRIWDELTVGEDSIDDFRRLLDDSYRPRINFIEQEEEQGKTESSEEKQGKTESSEEKQGKTESPEEKQGKTESPEEKQGKTESPKEKQGKTESPEQKQGKTESPSPLQSSEPGELKKPNLVIISRNGSRAIENEKDLVGICEEIGFAVKVLRPDKTTEMARLYRQLNATDVMIGVHGAAMTHLLFMPPKTTFVQIVPLGTSWAAEAYYGEPARKFGLNYVEYKILPSESSLFRKYGSDDPVLKDPEGVAAKGWEVTKEVYLDGQNVRLDMNRFFRRITRVYQYAVRRKNKVKMELDWSWQLQTSANK